MLFDAFYPDGWRTRQLADVEAFLDEGPELVWVAIQDNDIIGWIGGRLHPEDKMGEVYILAISPIMQRQGVAGKLMHHLFGNMRQRGMAMMMVETGDDPGHASSRAGYEKVGFEAWPVARYFRKL